MKTMTLFACVVCLAVSCFAQSSCDIAANLNWCNGDHGFNEGATCGLTALSGASIGGLPALAAQPILGNTWDRTNMMGATITAYHAGFTQQATNAAICCQIHNPAVQQCLAQNPAAVQSWLNSH